MLLDPSYFIVGDPDGRGTDVTADTTGAEPAELALGASAISGGGWGNDIVAIGGGGWGNDIVAIGGGWGNDIA